MPRNGSMIFMLPFFSKISLEDRMSEERVLRQLAIKAFHVRAVSEGEKVSLKKEENKE